MKHREFLNSFGLFASICVTVIGVGIFSYPSIMANDVGSEGWLVTIIAGFVVYLLVYLIYRVLKDNDYKTFYSIMETNIGRISAKIFAIILSIYFVVSIAFGLRIFGEVIKMYLLERTPMEFIILVLILTGTYLVRGGIIPILKFNEISFWLMFVPMFLVLIFAVKGSDFSNILPVFNEKPSNYLRALLSATYSFGGIEIAYVVIPYLRDKKNIKKTLGKSIFFITFFYTIVVILCLAFFTKYHTKTLLWPTITLIRSIVIPGAFVERWEGIVMAIWILFYFTTFVNIFFFATDLIKDTFNLENVKISVIFVVPFIYIIALYPQNIAELYDYLNKVTPIFSTFSFIVLPAVLILANRIRGKGESRSEA